MKKKILTAIIFTATILVVNVSTIFAGWLFNDQLKKWYYFDEQTGTLTINSWKWIDTDKNGKAKCYCFDEMGFMYENCITPDGYRVNNNGEWEEYQGIPKIKYVEVNNTPMIITNTNTSGTGNTGYGVTSGVGSSRMLKNNIKEYSNVEIVEKKTINGETYKGILWMKSNGSTITVDTKNYNKMKLEFMKSTTYVDIEYEIVINVNGYEEEVLQFDEGESKLNYELEYSIGDDIDIILYYETSYNYANSLQGKGVYITSGQLFKYKEDKDD